MTAIERITEATKAVPADALIDKRNGKPKRVPRKVANAIRLIESGECTTIKAAAERVGLSREHLSVSLGKPHVQVFIARRSRETIGAAALLAANRMVELIRADSEHVSLQASDRILTSEGILKSDQRAVSVNVGIQAGFVLDLRDDVPALTPQQPTIDAKPLIEQGSCSPVDDSSSE